MSSSESQFQQADSSESSIEPVSRASSRQTSRTPGPPRKRRRRSESPELVLSSEKHHLRGLYREEYRRLFNEEVTTAATRFSLDPLYRPRKAQTGASQWTSEEKVVLFAALEKLGKDDVCGIAQAIGTKTTPEVKDFLILLHDVSATHRDAKVSLRDIPAAAEISSECIKQLEFAGDAMAWMQEKFEAKLEQARFGEYWLITPEISQEIEEAFELSNVALSPSPSGEEVEETPQSSTKNVPIPQILQDIPEAKLLNPSVLLKLSSSLFMNSSPLQQTFPHWSTLISPLAIKPSIYRTALMDYYTLVISLTRRLIQAATIQATSRLRSQQWGSAHGAKAWVKRRDVISAVDMLRLQRDGKELWRGVARRNKLQIFEGTAARKQFLNWDEVEAILDVGEKHGSSERKSTDAETPGFMSGTEDRNFVQRAARAGTPLPSRVASDYDDTESSNESDEAYDSDGHKIYIQEMSDDAKHHDSPSENMPGKKPENLTSDIEGFDREVSRQEEFRLWNIIDDRPFSETRTDTDLEIEVEEAEVQDSSADWRKWTRYQAEWEEHRTPVANAQFWANRRVSPDLNAVPSVEGYDTGTGDNEDENERQRRKRRRKYGKANIPILGAEAYAAKASETGYALPRSMNSNMDSDDDSQLLVQSVEDER